MSKKAIRFSDMPAYMAVRMILHQLFEAMEANEHGLIHDIDPEYLHDFRVAVRRTRCALRQLGKALLVRDVARFLPEFAWLGSVTSPARDLDVYMLNLDDYEATLPRKLQGGMTPLRTLLAGKRKREKRQLIEQLRSSRYLSLKRDYRAFLDQRTDEAILSKKAKVPIMEMANQRIGRMFKRVLREGRTIRDDSPPEALHELRKSCKKLRYLLEFFRLLYAEDEIEHLIRAMKKLQDNLGELQDLAVEMAALRGFQREMAADGDLPDISNRAMDALVEQLQQRHDAVRMAFAGRFKKFASAKNRHRFERLLGEVYA